MPLINARGGRCNANQPRSAAPSQAFDPCSTAQFLTQSLSLAQAQVLRDLGDMPGTDSPRERAMWVGALINPIPALGVSLEIRPVIYRHQAGTITVNNITMHHTTQQDTTRDSKRITT